MGFKKHTHTNFDAKNEKYEWPKAGTLMESFRRWWTWPQNTPWMKF